MFAISSPDEFLSYIERLKQRQLPALKYRRLRGDMIEVFKIVHNYYDSEAAVELNFNTLVKVCNRSVTELAVFATYQRQIIVLMFI